MACFLVPATEAAVTTIATKVIEKNETTSGATETKDSALAPFAHKLSWLNKLLWGGSALLLFEHVWHGEVVPFFPFLTAAANPADTAEMLSEMATSGVAMAVLITLVWVGMVAVTSAIEKRPSELSAPVAE